MKLIVTLFLVMGMTSVAHSQTITIIDQQTEQPLKGAVLMSGSSQSTVVTNAEGQADISALAGAETILIRSLDYKTAVFSFSQIEASDLEIALEQSIMNLDRVVVSATRWRQSSGNIPLNIASITPEEVALQNPQTAADLLGAFGKVFIQKSQQGGGSPMIRGFATNRLVYTIDGLRMNTAIFRGVISRM